MNLFFWKRVGVLLTIGIFCTFVAVFSTLALKNIVYGAIMGVLSAIPLTIIANALLSDPLFRILEGKGILCASLDSAGFVTPYDVEVRQPQMGVQTKRGFFVSIFDRKLTTYLAPPKNGIAEFQPNGDLLILLKKDEKSRAGMQIRGGRPMFFFNEKIGSFITKESLANMESEVMTEHLTLVNLDQNRRMTTAISDLTKHASDLFKPNKFLEFLHSPLFGLIIGIILIVVLLLFLLPNLPKLMQGLQGLLGGATQQAGQATQTVTNSGAQALPINPNIPAPKLPG